MGAPRSGLPARSGAGLRSGLGTVRPRPGKFVGWHLIVGTQEDGEQIDLFRGGAPLDRHKPELLAATFPNGRWRKLMMNLPVRAANPYLVEGFAEYYWRDWNADARGAGASCAPSRSST